MEDRSESEDVEKEGPKRRWKKVMKHDRRRMTKGRIANERKRAREIVIKNTGRKKNKYDKDLTRNLV